MVTLGHEDSVFFILYKWIWGARLSSTSLQNGMVDINPVMLGISKDEGTPPSFPFCTYHEEI